MVALRGAGNGSAVKAAPIEKYPQIPVVLPQQCVLDPRNDCSIITLPHPRTFSPTQFMIYDNRLLELTAVSGPNEHLKTTPVPVQASHSARSLLFGGSNQIISDSKILVATPINPLFLILPTLFSNRQKFLAADYLEEFSEVEGCELLSRALFEDRLSLICDVLDDDDGKAYRLSTDKLVLFLNTLTNKIISQGGISSDLYKLCITDPLTGVDINEQDKLPADLVELAKKKLAINMVSTYLTEDVVKLFIETAAYDFSTLDLHIKKLAEERAKATEIQKGLLNASSAPSGKRKRSTSTIGLPERAAKKVTKGVRSLQKADTSKNRSLKDMFARKSA
ncbi:hypothetical protein AWJ20_1234 [Sugiyamaella lignohabitans]|uniref:Ribonuclease H2 subunit B n=1 Tax=Sugiyamaella lignohabitans TaxID=796027 RepID=A0A161HV90_9ASCO|nr:uncharacterized protein AWJ20_1234 [Sugiyamaella lignohabitans]ANB12956.1 hypothetical protein AWJ20_1234 [Sugiyamaella lignohabitans]